jgi:hypothetical protein
MRNSNKLCVKVCKIMRKINKLYVTVNRKGYKKYCENLPISDFLVPFIWHATYTTIK